MNTEATPSKKPNTEELTLMASAIRALSMDMVERANSGHPGLPMGVADVVTVLFSDVLKFNPTNPDWADRDRFILSAGHGSALLYSLLHLTGYSDFTLDQLKNFRQLHSLTAGHPEYGHGFGIETTTGPLGQGFANAVGMAMAEKHLNARFGGGLMDHRTYVLVGDGCLAEGISHEAANLAGHLALDKLVVLWDNNEITIDGKTSLATSEDTHKRFQSYGWQTLSCDGHDFASIRDAFEKIKSMKNAPVFLDCKTIIGNPAPNKKGTSGVHGAPLGKDELAAAKKIMQWDYAPFEIPENVRALWLQQGSRAKGANKKHAEKLAAHPLKDEFRRRFERKLNASVGETVTAYKSKIASNKPAMATRKASQDVIGALFDHVPELFGGSADLTGSNLTRCPSHKVFDASNPDGTYIHYGVREHGMASAMNGIALHGGLIAYGATFLVFTDYCKPSIRLSALMNQRAIYVMTHDSIGLGEDGPTHQPVEHLTMLRTIPGLSVFRPCDAVETMECWQLALENTAGPSVIALSRQAVPTMRVQTTTENLSAKGGYVIKESGGAPQILLMASGTEVAICADVMDILSRKNISSRLVSIPCLETFERQDDEYRKQVLGANIPLFTVEAAHTMPWQAMKQKAVYNFGINSFGASGKADDLYKHFKLDADSIADKILASM